MNARALTIWTGIGALAAILAWHVDLWLLPILWTAAISAAAVRRARARGVATTRIATLAGMARPGAVTAPDLEQLVVADLAARAADAPAVLIAAREVVDQMHDPWRRSLAIERLDAAAALLVDGGVRPASRVNSAMWFAAGWSAAGVATASITAGAVTGSRLWMVVAVLAVAVLGGAIGAVGTRSEAFTVAVTAAVVDPMPVHGGVLDEDSLIELLARLGSGERRAFTHAETIAGPVAAARIRAAAHAAATRSRMQT